MEFKHTDNLAVENEFPKLVRDNIPEINKQKYGKELPVRIAGSDEEYVRFLAKKLIEEATELSSLIDKEGWEEDLADLLEVADALREAKKLLLVELESIKEEKKKRNGGFSKRILMLGRNS